MTAPECVKCGERHLAHFRFCSRANRQAGCAPADATGEHLDVTCGSCGYRWTVPCADAAVPLAIADSLTALGRTLAAVNVAARWGGIDGAHHKAWVIDQMVRRLTGCQEVLASAIDANNQAYTYKKLGASEEYLHFIGENEDWEEGIAP